MASTQSLLDIGPIILVHFLFYTILFQAIIILIFYFINVARPAILNSLIVLCIMTPLYMLSLDIGQPIQLLFISQTASIFFPITFTSIVIYSVVTDWLNKCLPVVIITSIAFCIYVLNNKLYLPIVISLFTLMNIYLLAILINRRRESFPAILIYFILIKCLLIPLLFLTENVIFPALIAGTFSILIFIMTAYMTRRRIITTLSQLNTVNDLNKKLSYKISRLRGSNDQYRKIIMEKDSELLQMSRHASLAEVTAGIAHELNQPLTGIKGIAQNMIDDINYEEFENLQAVSELLKICSLVDKSSLINNRIRTFSQKNLVPKKEVDLNKATIDALDLIKIQLKKCSIELIFVLDETIARIYGDKISIEQLIINLILNSKDAIAGKQKESPDFTGVIMLSTTSQDKKVKLLIEDNGSGISDEIIDKIWSPFFTTKKKESGTGIGLSICKKILQDHQATATVESNHGGTQFQILFPAIVDSSRK